jgi:hypothetical protein
MVKHVERRLGMVGDGERREKMGETQWGHEDLFSINHETRSKKENKYLKSFIGLQ